MTTSLKLFFVISFLFLGIADSGLAQLIVRGETVYAMVGPPIEDGAVLIRDGKIERVGRAVDILARTEDMRVLTAKVVTPGLIDAHTVVGFTGYLNQKQDQDQLERSEPIQPELRAIDAYNPQERLIEWVRGFGVTTIHTGHAPGELISGQTMIAKTTGRTTEDAVIVPTAMIAATLGDGATKHDKKSPGTRSKAVAMLRAKLIKAREYLKKQEASNESESEDDEDKKKGKPDRNLRLESLGRVLKGDWPLMVTVHRAHDIVTTLRIAKEFNIKLVLDGASEAYLVLDEIKAAGVPVIVHPTMMRSGHGQTENASMETAAKLHAAGIPIAMQSGYESYVPKTRVVLFETAIAASNGLSFDDALAACTVNAARILGIADRVGTLEPGKDADIALYDGDPFEYTTHCTGVVINGEVVSNEPR